MAHILLSEAQQWLENTKLSLTSLDTLLESTVSTNVLGRLADTYSDPTFGVQTWIDTNTTPALVRQIISMFYAGWTYDRAYSEMVAGAGTGRDPATTYGTMLRQYAETLLVGVISGSILLLEIAPNEADTAPEFYPTDQSSTTEALISNTDRDDTSLGPQLFGVQKVF
jgi:hypothetical protein